MVSKEKMGPLREFIRAEGRAEIVPEPLTNRRFSKMNDNEMLGMSSNERIIDLQRLHSALGEMEKQLSEKGVKVHPSTNEEGKLYSLQVYKSNGNGKHIHYSQIHENSMSVTLDQHGKIILELIDACLVEDKME